MGCVVEDVCKRRTKPLGLGSSPLCCPKADLVDRVLFYMVAELA